jgi:AcrR family transcriptional regulator
VADTITAIADSFVELLSKKGAAIDKITVKDLSVKAGYSRTTFYVHFCDVYDVMHTLEDMLLYHLSLNAEAYYMLFLDQLDTAEVEAIYNMLNHYGKYIVLLLAKDVSFMQRYKDKFISVITHKLEIESPGDIRKVYYSRVCASAMIESYLFWLEHKEQMSYDIIVKTCNRIAATTVYSDETIW